MQRLPNSGPMGQGGNPQQQQQIRYPSQQQQQNSQRRPFVPPQANIQQNPQFGRPGAPPTIPNRPKKPRRMADRILTPEIQTLIPDGEAYMALLSYEQKLDATINRKRMDYQEVLKRPPRVKKKLRIYISHSFMPGKEPENPGEEGAVPMWELRVEGRLLEENSAGSEVPPRNPTVATPLQKRKFSSFFKSLVIELDKDIYGPDNHLVEWHRTQTTNETDGFQVKRPGDRDVKCTILLLLDHQPMKYKLHPILAKLLGIAMDTRPKIIEALWQYIKTHKLQDPIDRDVINCDTFLEQVFATKKIRFMEIPARLQPVLLSPEPIVLHHIIKNSGQNTACYDIEVELDDPIKPQISTYLTNLNNVQDIAFYDQRICELVEQVNESKLRRDFYTNFSENPHEFIEKWLKSQSRDLKKIMSEEDLDVEEERRADYYYHPNVKEAVFRYIYGKVQQKRFELEATLGVKYN